MPNIGFRKAAAGWATDARSAGLKEADVTAELC
jgi:hypothetical protein